MPSKSLHHVANRAAGTVEQVAIRGADCAALALANLLVLQGKQVRVFTELADISAPGPGVLLSSAGQALLRRLGVLDALSTIGKRITTGLRERDSLDKPALKARLGVHSSVLRSALYSSARALGCVFELGAERLAVRRNMKGIALLSQGDCLGYYDRVFVGTRVCAVTSVQQPWRSKAPGSLTVDTRDQRSGIAGVVAQYEAVGQPAAIETRSLEDLTVSAYPIGGAASGSANCWSFVAIERVAHAGESRQPEAADRCKRQAVQHMALVRRLARFWPELANAVAFNLLDDRLFEVRAHCPNAGIGRVELDCPLEQALHAAG